MALRKAKGHEGKLEVAKRSGDGGLLDIAGADGNLGVCSNQIDFGQVATRELMIVAMDVTDRRVVWNSMGIQLYSLRRDANRCPSWALYEVRKTKNSQSGELCHPPKWRQTLLWQQRAGSGQVDVVGR
jgi:hypothetical protein